MDANYLVALAGGVLALLSPCAALLLPAFFAYAFTSPGKIFARTGIFYLGLLTTLVPLGAGFAGLGSLLTTHRSLLITIAGWLIVALGVVSILGAGFDFSRLFGRFGQRAQGGGAPAATTTYFLGMVSGVAGVCTGPILGAVLTVAMTSSSPVDGAILLAIYGLGMTVPLLLLALGWKKLGPSRINKLRGRTISVGRFELHTVSLITGIVLVILGAGFLLTRGFADFEVVSAQTGAKLQQWVSSTFGEVSNVVVIIVLALIALAAWFFYNQKRSQSRDASSEIEDDATAADQSTSSGR